MKTIKVSLLRPGIMFTKPVYVDGDTILVPPNVPIRDKDLERLRKWNVETVQTDGQPLMEGSSADPAFSAGKTLKKGENSKFLGKYLEAVKLIDTAFHAVEQNTKVPADEISRMAEDLIALVEQNPDELVGLTLQKRSKQPTAAMSSVNCLILSVVIGLNMKLPRHKLLNMAIGALVHDVGMTKIPKAVLDKSENLTPDEIEVMRKHTTYSYTVAIKLFGFPEDVGLVALQHHERWDGKGYPNGISGEQISVLARIVSVADAFEAMVRDRPYRNSMIGYQAMRQILNDNSRRFDSEILKVFIKSMGIYPIGSIVLLSDGSIGRVERTHADAPLRPTLRLLVDKRGKKLQPDKSPLIDLLGEKALFVARAISPKEANAED